MRICLQNVVSIQPRTSPVKFAASTRRRARGHRSVAVGADGAEPRDALLAQIQAITQDPVARRLANPRDVFSPFRSLEAARLRLNE